MLATDLQQIPVGDHPARQSADADTAPHMQVPCEWVDGESAQHDGALVELRETVADLASNYVEHAAQAAAAPFLPIGRGAQATLLFSFAKVGSLTMTCAHSLRTDAPITCSACTVAVCSCGVVP